ncbi:DNA alkylation repair protein [Candidatus Woesearchaeota archaeon]|nr:DNA alkylation repair protein [Candidatus Woesearchaeota archaeon]
MIAQLKEELQKQANPEQAKILKRFFKTGKGQYGEGDVFLGIKVPIQRAIAKKYTKSSLEQLQELLNTNIHEYRFTSLVILINKYNNSDEQGKKEVYEFYIQNIKNINNWDLVDISCPNIIGDYLLEKDKTILYDFAKSAHLWTKRIAIISTLRFIKNNQFEDTLNIAEILLKDKHDLLHKAVGWMLREVGKKNQKAEEAFLDRYYRQMPRTMLRYSIERFSEEKKKYYMKK